MQNIILSDTSCLILLSKIDELQLLRLLYQKITITRIIADEFGEPLPEWFEIKNPQNQTYQKILEVSLDKGEASAIAFAVEQSDCLLIIDDLKGRKYAEQLGISVTGTLSIFLEAKRKGYLNSVSSILKKIRNTNFHITKELERKLLEKAGETAE